MRQKQAWQHCLPSLPSPRQFTAIYRHFRSLVLGAIHSPVGLAQIGAAPSLTHGVNEGLAALPGPLGTSVAAWIGRCEELQV